MHSPSLAGCLAAAILAAAASCAGAAPAGNDETVPAWRYTVKPGDTLISIAQRYLAQAGDWPKIQKSNRIVDPFRTWPDPGSPGSEPDPV